MAKILVCDNEKDICNLLKLILKRGGHDVLVSLDGKECLAKWEKEKPDLVLLDIMMPDMSGWDVFQKIRTRDGNQKIAFLSVLEVSEERKRELMKEGLSDYIMKPFTQDQLLSKVEKILR